MKKKDLVVGNVIESDGNWYIGGGESLYKGQCGIVSEVHGHGVVTAVFGDNDTASKLMPGEYNLPKGSRTKKVKAGAMRIGDIVNWLGLSSASEVVGLEYTYPEREKRETVTVKLLGQREEEVEVVLECDKKVKVLR